MSPKAKERTKRDLRWQGDKHGGAYKGKCHACDGPLVNASGFPYHLRCSSENEARDYTVEELTA